jgi:hypothetical protein
MILPASAMPVIGQGFVAPDYVERWTFETVTTNATQNASFGKKGFRASSYLVNTTLTNNFALRVSSTPTVILNSQADNASGLPISQISNVGSGTISFWARNTVGGPTPTLGFSRENVVENYITFGIGQMVYRNSTGSFGVNFWTITWNYPAGLDNTQWNHYVYQTSGANVINAYCNGVIRSVSATQGTPNTGNNWFNDLNFGITVADIFRLRRSGSITYEGGANAAVDDLIIYNRELTNQQILDIYLAGRG